MLAPSPNLLRAGLALKANHVKLATRSYLRDRAQQATDSVTSYAVAAGLYAAAGIFLLAAMLVGLTALFRWIEIDYGLFQAFGAVGALLLLMSAITAGVAASRLKRRPREFPSLSSRLRVAIKSGPRLDPTAAAKDAGAAILMTSPAPPRRPVTRPSGGGNGRAAQIGLVLMAGLVGLAAARRRRSFRKMAADASTSVR
jgi:Putative Actinobacterial Holin-X, holin superfamily III